MVRNAVLCGLAALMVVVVGPPADAATFAEVGDAGELPATAQDATGTGSLTEISGTVSHPDDADMYRICIDGGDTFSATTRPKGSGTLNDSQLFLFRENGTGIITNDNDSPPSSDPATTPGPSTLPAGRTFVQGVFYLAISAYDYDPLDSANTETGFRIFPNNSEGVHGPSDPNDVVQSWNQAPDGTRSGTYVITLTGAWPYAPGCPDSVGGPPTPAEKCAALTSPPTGAIVGTSGDDYLIGTAGDDVIFGLGGNDRVSGGLGNDTLVGGPGVDQLSGVDGNDLLCGGTEGDALAGGNDNDELVGEAGADRLAGSRGDDTLDGGSENDQLDGGVGTNGNDGGSGTDTCVNGTNTNCEP